MYFLRGGLPWQGLRAATNKQKYEKIGEKKQSTPISELCEGFPEEFAIYMNYVRKLGFDEGPDYEFLRELFTIVLKTFGEQDDGVFDWMLLSNKSGGDTPAALLAQAHANAATARNAHRTRADHRRADNDRERERDREPGAPRRSARPPHLDGPTIANANAIATSSSPSPLLAVSSPIPARLKDGGSGAAGRGVSVSPLKIPESMRPLPGSRRQSPPTTVTPHASGTHQQHPFASTSASRAVDGGLGAGSEPAIGGGAGKYGDNAALPRMNGVSGFNMTHVPTGYPGADNGAGVHHRDRMDDGHGSRSRGFWAIFCCRA
jgi:casein kinase 1